MNLERFTKALAVILSSRIRAEVIVSEETPHEMGLYPGT